MKIPCAASLLVSALLTSPAWGAESHPTDGFVATIVAQDDAFTRAYNRCATTRLRTMFGASAEFVSADQGVTRRVGDLIDSFRRHDCGRVRREVDPASIVVRALPDYGALQFGVERYCSADAAACDGLPSRYVVVWKRYENEWKIMRLIRFRN